MSRFVNRLGLALIFFVASNAWALGLGDIRLQSSLNEPLRAEIQLLSATPEELEALTVALASAETFDRYGIDRPGYLSGLQFTIVNGGSDGSYVQITSRQPMTEPFLTFLVEASWSRGRLLREYTVLLDPPTFAPPQPARQAVQAPQRAEPSDAGTIQRPAQPAATPAPATRAPARQPAPVSQPTVDAPEPMLEDTKEAPREFVPPRPSQVDAGDLVVAESQTLWAIASSVRPDSSLTINQVMLAIYEANPGAFGGNINILKAGATLRIPSADDMYSIDRRSANAEAQRQHDSWDGSAASDDTALTDDSFMPAEPVEPQPVAEVEDSSSLTLVPPDEDPVGVGIGADETDAEVPVSREDEILDRIDAIEAEEIPVEQSLIDIRNDELARLRQELADIRGEVYEPPVEPAADGEAMDPFVDVTDEAADDATVEGATDDMMDEAAADEAAVEEPAAPPTDRVIVQEPEPGIVDKILGLLLNVWTLFIAGALVLVGGIAFFFLRGRNKDDEASEAWSPLDADDDVSISIDGDGSTQSIPPPDVGDETIVVEETAVAMTTADTIEVEAPPASSVEFSAADDDAPDMMEDTFSSETAVNLDQSDPIAEADFHMAYGLYDQAADLVNGALQADPDNRELLTKLCEIYFVWGNRDSFIDAAQRVKATAGDSADWDKIVIMGQQIAGDSELFAGAGVAGATKEVDLTFDSADDAGSGDLDMVFGDEGGDAGEDGDLDFLFDGDTGASAVDENLEITQQTPTVESTLESTAEMPTMENDMSDEGTAALPALDDSTLSSALESEGKDSDATAEIDLDDLGLDLDALDEAAASLDEDDEMEITGSHDALADTGINEAISDLEATGKNEQIEDSSVDFVLDQTGVNPAVGTDEDTDVGVDFDILAATGKTQVLPEQMKVETINEPISDEMDTMLAGDLDDVDGGGDKEHTGTEVLGDDMETLLAGNLDDVDGGGEHAGTEVLGDNDATMLAPSPSDEDFDFAKTEALPPSVMDDDTEATAETPALASTDMDLDLDDLTAALDLSEIGDTVEMPGSDATVEQPRPPIGDPTGELPTPSFGGDDDLSEARTMTEVGTKLDLARAYVDMGDPGGARSILEEVLDEGDDDQRKQAQDLLDSLPS
ncbi:MAG: FimV/HubP family polar landmark protein [Pseudomonadota bacterium]